MIQNQESAVLAYTIEDFNKAFDKGKRIQLALANTKEIIRNDRRKLTIGAKGPLRIAIMNRLSELVQMVTDLIVFLELAKINVALGRAALPSGIQPPRAPWEFPAGGRISLADMKLRSLELQRTIDAMPVNKWSNQE